MQSACYILKVIPFLCDDIPYDIRCSVLQMLYGLFTAVYVLSKLLSKTEHLF